jgi:hypothetical protein
MTKSLYLSFEEAALMLKLHHTTIRQRKAGTEMLTHVPQGRRRFLLKNEVEALQQRTIKQAKEQDQERKTLLRLAS